MKTGRNLVELAQELQRRADAKEDFLAPTTQLEMVSDPNIQDQSPRLQVDLGSDVGSYGITDHTHRQIGTWANVPAKYYDKMRHEAPQLLQQNVNHWFGANSTNRMVRTLDGKARAFLSDRYRRIDNEDIAEQILPILMEGDVAIRSCEVTERKLYIKATFPLVQGEVKVGDVVEAGVSISNSEIGLGSLDISPLIYRLACLNGMKSMDYGLSRYHVGRKIEGDGQKALELFREETMVADDQALMMKIHDIVKAASQKAVFDQIIQKMKESTEGPVLTNPVAAVEVLAKSHSFNDNEKTSVLENLIKGADYSRYGVLNAITATANTHHDYDRASEFETLGGKILDINPKDWKVVAEATV